MTHYAKTINAGDKSAISVLATNDKRITIRVYFENVSTEIDLTERQVDRLELIMREALDVARDEL